MAHANCAMRRGIPIHRQLKKWRKPREARKELYQNNLCNFKALGASIKMQVHTREYPTLNAENVVDFLMLLLARMPPPCERLRRAQSEPEKTGVLHVILDRGRYQHCAAIWEFAAQNPRLRLHYLPAYSPNLNTTPRLWKLLHEHTTNNRYTHRNSRIAMGIENRPPKGAVFRRVASVRTSRIPNS